MKKVKLGVLGCGVRIDGLISCYALNPAVEFTAFCDYADGLAEKVAKKYQDITGIKAAVYTDYEKMMQDKNFDGLLITVDPDYQVDYACDAMERGVHVMTEVPCCTKIEDCYKLVETVEKTKMKYQLAEQTRYWYFIQEWKKLADAGELGKLLMVEGQYLHYEKKWDYFMHKKTKLHDTVEDGALANDPDREIAWRYRLFKHPIFYLPHTLSPLLSITGGRIEKVACFGTKEQSYCAQGIAVRDIESAIMYNSNDVIFNVRAGFTSPHSTQEGTHAHWYNVKGTKGSVEWARASKENPKIWTLADGWKERPDWTLEVPYGKDTEEFIKHGAHGGADGYPLKHFVEAIVNDTTPLMDVYKAVETAAPAILAAKSSELGGVMLEVPDFRKR